MEKSELEKLCAKREVMFAKVKWELSVAESLNTRNPSYEEVCERKDKLTELAGNFDTVQTTIEETTSNLTDVASVFNYRLQFDEIYFKAKGLYTIFLEENQDRISNYSSGSRQSVNDLRDAIRALVEAQQTLIRHQIQPNSTSAGSQMSNQDHAQNVKLPQLNIAVFKGDRKNWHSFKDLFVSTIHSRTDLKDSLKMQYLLSYLDGDAKRMVSSFPISDANYKEAWDTLEAHYDKKKYTVFALVREFIDQPSTTTVNGLRKLVGTSDDVIRQLKALGNEFESRDPWLIHILLEKVDRETRSLWAQKIIDVDTPTFVDFLEFLQKRCDALETCTAFTKRTNQGDMKKEYLKAHDSERVRSLHANVSSSSICVKCSKDHPIYHCERFKEMDVVARRELAQSSRLCFNCLRPSHTAKKCSSKSVCRISDCQQRHHTLLCTLESKQADKKPEQEESKHETGLETAVASVNVNATQTLEDKHEFSLLPTVVARVEGSDGKQHVARILIDSGSQVSLITEACVKRLGLRRSNASLEVTGINAEVIGKTAGKVSLVISSRFEEATKIITQAYVLGKLTATLPCQRFNVSNMPYLAGLQLADPHFNKPSSTDIILGADVFLSILQSGQVKDHNGNPVAQRSVFGWMVAGKISKQDCIHTHHSIINLHPEVDIDRTLRLFWEDQELHRSKQLTKDEQRVVELFNSTLTRSQEGRFIVRLPMDDSKLKLGNSLIAATRRLRCIERKFDSDSNFKKQYLSFMQEYQDLGHMEIVPPTKIDVDCSKSYYLPHHGVIKEDSITTKLRVVFDGSCSTTTGASLNDVLLDAPNINADLFEVLLRFRSYPVVFIADIEKMYRQVLVHSDDTDYLRIVWRDSADKPVQHFRLLTVTYGLKNSGFLAMAALHKAAEVYEMIYPEAAERIKRHIYVDDLTSGADSVNEAKQLIKQINEILSEAGFTLRKWCSNSAAVLESLSDTINSSMPIQFPDERNIVKALGTHWLPKEDVFTFKVTMPIDRPNTKHQLLSDSAKLFDPFGWFAPVIVRVKILYQKCWLYDLNWHDLLPPTIEEEWIEVKETLHQLEQIKIPRWAANYNGNVQLHGFSDASEEAYAAVVYLRSVDYNNEIHVTLLAAKTKVAPVRQISIPRLELNAAELLAKLMKQVAEPLERFNIERYAWTDSTIVLQWLSGHPRKWDTYVANRTSLILDVLPRKHWSHVTSKNNPADCASRGISPSDLVNHPLWWTGPAWLYEDSSTWNREVPDYNNNEDTLEVRKRYKTLNITVSLPVTTHVIEKQIIEQRSSLIAACWQLARVSRFTYNMKCVITGNNKLSGSILPSELHQARMKFVRLAQKESYATEIKALACGDEIPVKSGILNLYPFLDDAGTLRVGGRLQQSLYAFDVKHPIILSKTNRFTKLLVEEIHVNNCHAGPTLMTATINQRYWIQGCQVVIKQVIRKCLSCCRQKAQTAKQLMGSLPAARVTACRPFAHVGVDYAGPIMVRCSNTRGARCMKGYIVVFICLSTKAIHLEVAGDLSTDTFLGAFRRMISRRGYCSEVWSDNGTNLVGANRQLQEIYEITTNHAKGKEHYFSNLGIRWRFIPPASPHQGGIWEAAVKSAKELLRPIIGDKNLTYEELSTVLCQVEACLNSRPLCSLSSNPESLEALTPGHFLVGQPLNMLPEPEVTHLKVNYLDRWKMVQRYTEEFWRRWRDEYMATLQPRGKWKMKQDNLKLGSLVLVKNDNSPPSTWDLARIVAVHPDQQGLVRNVTLRRGKSEYQRSVQKLCPLPD
ncbi:uncharacterized protein LOC131427220 [Malaya genurostris]|uniref:uncharacterized protein LOC131427220 n=1 Tax=Malaya genurostris TaxID=325434 RepID=UPI0026F39FE6|nr:uncharacterized protein LOC131427220 [Malaya genurostris]